MKHVHLTWYLLVDGTHADPNDVAPDKDGVLRHTNGLAVALHDNGVPQTIGRGAVENKHVEAAKVAQDVAAASPAAPEAPREMEPEPKPAAPKKPGYKTRKA